MWGSGCAGGEEGMWAVGTFVVGGERGEGAESNRTRRSPS